MCLNVWPIGSGTISGLVVGMALLEEVCHCGGRVLMSHMLKFGRVWNSLLLFPADQDHVYLQAMLPITIMD